MHFLCKNILPGVIASLVPENADKKRGLPALWVCLCKPFICRSTGFYLLPGVIPCLRVKSPLNSHLGRLQGSLPLHPSLLPVSSFSHSRIARRVAFAWINLFCSGVKSKVKSKKPFVFGPALVFVFAQTVGKLARIVNYGLRRLQSDCRVYFRVGHNIGYRINSRR